MCPFACVGDGLVQELLPPLLHYLRRLAGGCESSVFGACRRARGGSRSYKNGGGRAYHGFPNSCASAAKPTTTAPLPTLTMPFRLITLSNISMLFAPQASRRVV